MGLAVSCGYGDRRLVKLSGFAPKVLEQNTVIIGVRDLDPEERRLLAKSKVRVFAMDEIDRLGILEVIDMAVHIASLGTDLVHLSIDMDVLDPSEAPAVGYTISGGMTFREMRTCLEMFHKLDIPSSVDISEINTTLDVRNRTASIGVQLLRSAFGKKLY
jgi:arginase